MVEVLKVDLSGPQSHLREDYFLLSKRWDKSLGSGSSLFEETKNPVCVNVAVYDNSTIGFAVLGKSVIIPNTLEIAAIYIDQPHRQRGVGSKLVEQLIQETKANRFGRISAYTLQNSAFYKLLLKFDFSPTMIGRRLMLVKSL